MVIAEINTVNGGSTGTIMHDIADIARSHGLTVYTFSAKIYRRGSKNKYKYTVINNHYYYGNEVSSFIHKCLGRFTGFNGFFSIFTTWRLINKLKHLNVDIIHLHNLHDFCINLPLLFNYIKKNNISVIWTLHDCWSFTGHCTHFTFSGCYKWKNGCGGCPNMKVNPRTYFDSTRQVWNLKKSILSKLNKMIIVTPSSWLAGEVKQSFLGCYPVEVIHNGIDLSIFRYRESMFRKRFNIEKKFMLLGVASIWDERKGLNVFIELAKRLDYSLYQIVLVGTNDEIDKLLPDCIISIHRTTNQIELAEIYSAANLFVNPTLEDTYPTVNMESIACGTPVLTYSTGGSPEIITKNTGVVVKVNSVESLIIEIERFRLSTYDYRNSCIKEADVFNKWDNFYSYVNLYRQITNQ